MVGEFSLLIFLKCLHYFPIRPSFANCFHLQNDCFHLQILNSIRNFILGAEDDRAEDDRAEDDGAENDRAED